MTIRADFLRAAKGRRFHTGLLTLQALRRPEADGLRFGLTVTRKVGHATERNRIKRRLRVATAAVGRPSVSQPYDVVVIGRRDILTASFHSLCGDLERGLATVLRGPAGPASRPDAPGAHASHV